MQHIESGIVFGKMRVPGIPKDRFHEVEVADQAGRREKADLHCFGAVSHVIRSRRGAD
jgi:hypothetical protein